MKRPLAVIGFSFTAAAAVAFLVGSRLLNYLIISAALISVVLLIIPAARKKSFIPAVFISCTAAFLWVMCFYSVYVQPIEPLYGENVVIEGKLCELPYEKSGYYYYKIETDFIYKESVPNKTTVFLSSREPIYMEPYDTIKASVSLYDKSSDSFYYYNISKNRYLTGYINKVISVTENNDRPLYYHILSLRKAVLDIISDKLPDRDAELVSAVLLGEKSGMTYAETETFRAAGISHIIVVSGFHLVIMTQIMLLFLRGIFAGRKRAASFVCIIFVFLYMAVAGFTPSVLRAGIMQILYLFAQTAILKTDSLNSLGLASLIIVFLNPYNALNISFLLSFSATLGIVLWNEKLYRSIDKRIFLDKADPGKLRRLIRKPVKSMISILCVTITAQIFTIPIVILFFKSFSPYTLISNLLTSPVVSLLIISSLIMVLLDLSVILAFIDLPFVIMSGLLSELIYNAAEMTASFPYSLIRMNGECTPICLVLCVFVIFLIMIPRNIKSYIRVIFIVFYSVLIFITGYFIEYEIKKDSVKISVMDCGNGMTFVLSDYSHTLLFSCGGESKSYNNIRTFINDLPVTDIDYMLLWDKKRNTSSYARRILKDYRVNTIHVYDEDKLSDGLQDLYSDCNNIIKSKQSDNKIMKTGNDSFSFSVYNTVSCKAALLNVYDKDILILQSGTDCLKIPEEWRRADFLIDGGNLCNTDVLQCKRAVISDKAEMILTDMDEIPVIQDNIYFTGGFGNLGLRIYNDGRTDIRREKYWQS